jgi:hypothetical protein
LIFASTNFLLPPKLRMKHANLLLISAIAILSVATSLREASATTPINTSENHQPRQLIAQSCRNIEVRPTNGKSLTFKRGVSATTCGYKFHFQSDGNLVLYKSGRVLWATGTDGRGEILAMQADGNLVIYGGGRALWATNTDRNGGAFWLFREMET